MGSACMSSSFLWGTSRAEVADRPRHHRDHGKAAGETANSPHVDAFHFIQASNLAELDDTPNRHPDVVEMSDPACGLLRGLDRTLSIRSTGARGLTLPLDGSDRSGPVSC